MTHILEYNPDTGTHDEIDIPGPEIGEAGPHTHPASDITSGLLDQARLGAGSLGTGTKVLYDDQTYKVPAAGSTASGTRSMLLMGG